MNYLAHAYLSGNDESVIVGNFIADHIKGKAVERYAGKIKTGIMLHRHIDSFTDEHPVVRKSISRIKGQFGRYSGVIVDMFYDHLLAVNWQSYSAIPLKQFTRSIYKVMFSHFSILPPRTKRLLPFMMADDWLAGYRELEGLQQALTGMSRRTRFNSGMENAVEVLETDYNLFQSDFLVFFSELKKESEEFLINIP